MARKKAQPADKPPAPATPQRPLITRIPGEDEQEALRIAQAITKAGGDVFSVTHHRRGVGLLAEQVFTVWARLPDVKIAATIARTLRTKITVGD